MRLNNLQLPFPEKHFESQLEIALCHYGLDRASLQFFSQRQDGCDPLTDRGDLRRQPIYFLTLRGRQIQSFPPRELPFIKPDRSSAWSGSDFENTADGVIVEHIRLRPAGFEVRVLLLHLIEQAIDHRANQRQCADRLPVDFWRGVFRHRLPPWSNQYKIQNCAECRYCAIIPPI